MRKAVKLSGVAVAALLILSGPFAASALQPHRTGRAEPLCRRPGPLPPLPPVVQQNRQSGGYSGDSTGADVIVTGARLPRPVYDTPVPVSAVSEERVSVSDTASAPDAPPPTAPAPPPPPPPPPMAPEAAPPAVVAPAIGSTGEMRSSRIRPPEPRAGQLTAGDHDDLLNPLLYARYVANFLQTQQMRGVPDVDTRRVLTVAVEDNSGRPIPFARVTLTCVDGNSLSLATLADGTAVFYPGLDRLGPRVTLTVPGAGGPRTILLDRGSGAQRHSVTIGARALPVRKFDLMLVIDTTGSMGDEMAYLKSELRSILRDVAAAHPGLDIRLSMVAYRDVGDDYVTLTVPFTPDLGRVQTALAARSANGGGDYPEAMDQAMHAAVSQAWRPDAVKSLLLVADAPPHDENVGKTWAVTEIARARRIQIVPVAASGVGDTAEYVMRAMAAATQSRYLFLTDDSGIGNPHAEPSIDCYLVTHLNSLVRRVLDSQISGRRVEPRDGELIRTVGRYDNGRCILPPDFGRQP